jgi:tRNA pseudouridine55 synthase
LADGVLIIDKPPRLTSHDVVARVRRLTRVKRVGHAGTLDPDATGVLVVCVGRATKISRFLMEKPKEYLAGVRLGVETDTLDADGRVLAESDPSGVTAEDVAGVLDRFRGEVVQTPPMVSALKRDGKRLYELARKGVEVERPPRTVVIHRLDLLAYEPPMVRVHLHCSKGTYVRVLAADIGTALGCGAHLSELRRTAVGRFSADGAITLDALEERVREGGWEESLIPISEALSEYPAVRVHATWVRRVANGGAVTQEAVSDYPAELAPRDRVRILGAEGQLLGVGTAVIPGREASHGYPGLILVKPERMLVGSGAS